MLSIAIATMRRWDFLKDSIPLYLDQACVKEIIICDETGEDYDAIRASSFGTNPKLRLFKNDERLGIYQNKRKALSLATAPWVAVLDSDNHFSEEWFETLMPHLAKAADKDIFASAEFKTINMDTGESATPCMDFTGLQINCHNWNSLFTRAKWAHLLNDGNWVLSRNAIEFLPSQLKSSDLEAADAIYMLSRWISNGYTIHYVKDLSYLHMIHSASSWLQTSKESTRILNTTDWLYHGLVCEKS